MTATQRIPRPLVALPKPEPASAEADRNNPGIKPVLRNRVAQLVTGEPDAATAHGWARAARASMVTCESAPKRKRIRLLWIGAIAWLLLAALSIALSGTSQRDPAPMRVEPLQ